MMPEIDYSKYIYSITKHYIENCGHDENKKYKGGKAGDQSGSECYLRSWYNRPWSCVLHYPDPDVRMLIAHLAIACALNDNIGYDQGQRTTLWKELCKVGYDPSLIKVPCEADCTSSTTAIVKCAGEFCDINPLRKLSISITSRNMCEQFSKAGFVVRRDKRYLTSGDYLSPGDILLYESHHAAINITVGKFSSDSSEDKVLITGGSVYVREGDSTTTPAIGIVHRGDKLDYTGVFSDKGSGWYQVTYHQKLGYVSSRYSRVV